MVKLSNSKNILTDNSIDNKLLEKLTESIPNIKILNIDNFSTSKKNININPEFKSNDAIYIYFTSGTTGKPKAILGKNISLMQFILWEIKKFNITENFVISQFTSQCHDPFLRDIFVPLAVGGKICIPKNNKNLLSSVKLINYIDKSKINIIHCTPSLFRIFNTNMLSNKYFKNLKYIFMAGERILPKELANWYQIFGSRIQIINLYGPTETTLAKTYYPISPSDVNKNSIPIGRPIDSCKIFIMDKNLKSCKTGEIGEIIIYTPYMSHGYYLDKETTMKKFIKNPISDNSRNDLVYKTGDLGRILSDGNIEFIGRIDRQIKIRGFRVELDEVENTISKYDGIKKCIVDFKENSNSIKTDSESRCIKCGITLSYPGIKTDNEGICNICNFYELHKEKANSYFKNMNNLKSIFNNIENKKRNYDCLLLYSGGKDSTYVLYKLKEMNLRILVYTFDNGFISKTALDNIKNVVNKLNVELIIDNYNNMNKIFRDGLKEENSVCNGCFKVLRARSTKIAYNKGIKYIVTGFSRGQIFDLKLSDIYKQNIFNPEEIEEKILHQRLLYHGKSDYISSTFDEKSRVTKKMIESTKLIDFYRYTDVSKKEILSYLKSKNNYWENPSDTGFCSSNCLINDVGIFIQRKENGYDNYTYPTSWEVRTNHISLDEAESEYKGTIDTQKVEKILNEIDYKDESINKKASDIYLAAYFTSNANISEKKLRSHLEKTLPDYMIPSYLIRLDKIPVNENNKIDYKNLPDPKKIKISNYSAPKNFIEEKLEKIWCQILNTEKISTDAEFLKSGGNSLSIMSLISEIYQNFEIEMPIHEIFSRPTIRDLAEYIKEEKASENFSNELKESNVSKITKINNKLILREAKIKDFEKIHELNKRGFGSTRKNYQKYWRYIWEKNPIYRSDRKKQIPIGWLLENINNEIVGFIGNIPYSYNYKNKKLIAAAAAGWVVDKEYRKFSLYLLEKYWDQKNIDIFITNTASKIAYKTFTSTGAKILPLDSYTESMIFITDYKKTFKDISIKNNIPNVFISPASLSLKTFDFIRGKSKIIQNVNVKELKSKKFDSRFNKFWNELKKLQSNMLIANRDEKWLNWHYNYSFYINDIWIYYIEKNNQITSYAIFKIREKPNIQQNFVQLIDLQDLENNSNNILALISEGILRCKRNNFSYLKILGFSKNKRNIINKLNPYYKKHEWSLFLYKTNNKKLDNELLDFNIWDASPHDGDETI